MHSWCGGKRSRIVAGYLRFRGGWRGGSGATTTRSIGVGSVRCGFEGGGGGAVWARWTGTGWQEWERGWDQTLPTPVPSTWTSDSSSDREPSPCMVGSPATTTFALPACAMNAFKARMLAKTRVLSCGGPRSHCKSLKAARSNFTGKLYTVVSTAFASPHAKEGPSGSERSWVGTGRDSSLGSLVWNEIAATQATYRSLQI